MDTAPSLEELLLAVADFVEQDVRPALQDPSLRFRALIAANLARMGVLERRMDEWHDGVELDGLRALLGEVRTGSSGDERREALREANDRLAAAIRSGDGPAPEDVATHLRRVLAGELAITNPRFDTDHGW